MTSLAKALEPSSRAAAPDGPKHGIPAAVTASATPATSGASGPTTTSPDAEVDGQGRDGRAVHRVDVVERRDLSHARVARCGVHLGDGGVAGEGEDQRVLPAAGTDHEDSIAAQPSQTPTHHR